MIIIYACAQFVIVYGLNLIIFNFGFVFHFPRDKLKQSKEGWFSFEIFVPFHICRSQLAESLYEYGCGNDKKALELLGPDFDANNCKV